MELKKICAVFWGIFSLWACNQNIPESEIPSVVLNTLEIQFSNATNVEWEKKGAIYEVEFEINHVEHEALIEETGAIIKYRKEILLEELPQALRATLKAKENHPRIDDIHFLAIGENTYYQVEFKGTLSKPKKVFNHSGEEIQEVNFYD